MAWTTPSNHVWATGELVTGALMQTYIASNLTFVGTPLTARMVGNAAQTITQGTSANWNAASSDDPQSIIQNSGGTSCLFSLSAWTVPSSTRYLCTWSIVCSNPGATGSTDFRVKLMNKPVIGVDTQIAASSQGGYANPALLQFTGSWAGQPASSGGLRINLDNTNDGTHGSVSTDNTSPFSWFDVKVIGWT